MDKCAIDIHHHYLPPGLVEEAKSHGKALGVEITEANGGMTRLCFSGGAKISV